MSFHIGVAKWLDSAPYKFFNPIDLKFGQSNLKTFAMQNCKAFVFSLNGVTMAMWKVFFDVLPCNKKLDSNTQCPICPKLHVFDTSSGLRTSMQAN